jgi:hypothetical protein
MKAVLIAIGAFLMLFGYMALVYRRAASGRAQHPACRVVEPVAVARCRPAQRAPRLIVPR